MNDEIVTLVPNKVEYVLVGHAVKAFKKGIFTPVFKTGVGGYLIGKDLKPTREIEEALVLELEEYDGENYWFTNNAGINVIGGRFQLMLKSKAEKWLLEHPLPRKSISKKIREQVYPMFGGRCAYCGREIAMSEMQVDHIKSHMSNGGEDSVENYFPACSVCNRVKSNWTLEGFRDSIRNCARIHHDRKPKDQHIYADSDKMAEYYGLLGDDWKEKPIVFYFEKEKK